MVIYQVHEIIGGYGEVYDILKGSYLRKERAFETVAELAKEHAYSKMMFEKCENCPMLNCAIIEETTDHLSYCSEHELGEDSYGVYCENHRSFVEDSTFNIVEVEVEE